MEKQFVLGHCLLILCLLCYFVNNSGADLCQKFEEDCKNCIDVKDINCHFVVNKENKNLTKCLSDPKLLEWKTWNFFEELKNCTDDSNSTQSGVTDASDVINVKSSTVKPERNNTKESNDSSVINPHEERSNTENEKVTVNPENNETENNSKPQQSENDSDNPQPNTNVDNKKNATKNEPQETPKSTSKPKPTTKASSVTPKKEETTINNSTVVKPTAQEEDSSFHGGSFIGGIILVICISLAIFFGIKYYRAYRDGRPFSHRLFGNGGGFAAERQDSDEPGFPF